MTDLVDATSNMPASYQELLKQFEPETNLTGGSFTSNRRLSIRGGVFRKVINGKEVGEIEARTLKVVVVKAAPVSRMYYKGAYSPGETNPPACWSEDTGTQKPAAGVPDDTRQCDTCINCPQNIKGSGQGESRACRFQQRIAVLIADEDGKINGTEPYLLSLPATSVFGGDQKKMSMQAYARTLNAHKTALATVLTEVRFDTDSSTPKLCFRPIRPLEESELKLSINAQRSEDTADLVSIKVAANKLAEGAKADADTTPALPPLFEQPEADPEPQAKAKEAAESEDAPRVRTSKSKEEKPKTPDLASLLDEIEFDD